MSDKITCPKCKYEIEVTEVLSAQLRAELRAEFDAEQQRTQSELEAKWNKEREQLEQQAIQKAKQQVAVDFQDVQQQLADAQTRLKTSQQAELDLRKERRQLQHEKESLELTVNRRIDEERVKIREAAKKEAAEERQLKEAEKDKLISDLRGQIEELKRKSEEGSQQTQGEVMEIELETVLQRHFPYDTITPVPKGIHGGDVLQIVHDTTSSECGRILWESKRTKNWSDGWLPKLRDDQRAAKAQFSILVSMEMPRGLTTFDNIDGVWVTNWQCALGLAVALRAGLLEIAAARRSQEGKQDKMELLYNYLSGPDFRHRVEGIVEAFTTLKNDLETEKRAIQKAWAKREKQLDAAVTHTVGMYGDLQGIVGKSLQELEGLDIRLLEGDDSSP